MAGVHGSLSHCKMVLSVVETAMEKTYSKAEEVYERTHAMVLPNNGKA